MNPMMMQLLGRGGPPGQPLGQLPLGAPGGLPPDQPPPSPLLDALGGAAAPMAMAPPTGALPNDVLMALMAQLRSAGM